MKLSELVEKYVAYRDRKAEYKAEYEAKVALLEEKMGKIEAVMLDVFDKNGMDSVKTPMGTAYVSVRSTASVADREVFMEYVISHEEWSLLEVRASKAAVEQFKSANEDLPPGVSWRSERVVNFRRSS